MLGAGVHHGTAELRLAVHECSTGERNDIEPAIQLHDGEVGMFPPDVGCPKHGAGQNGAIEVDTDDVDSASLQLGGQRSAAATGVEHTRRLEARDEVGDGSLRCHIPTAKSINRHLPQTRSPLGGPLLRAPVRRIVRRMPRLQVYLPDDLYDELKRRDLPASELLQVAVRAELERRGVLEATDDYLTELAAEVGEPTGRQQSRADAIVRRIRDRQLHQTG